MHSLKTLSLITCVTLVLLSCEKEDGGCLGCDTDYPPVTYTDTLNGQVFLDCGGTPAAYYDVEMIRSYQSDDDFHTVYDTIQTDAEGRFQFIYSLTKKSEFSTNEYLNIFAFMLSTESIIYIGTPTNKVIDFTYTLIDSVYLQMHFLFSAPYTAADTLYYGKNDDITYRGFITGPFTDTTIGFPVFPASDNTQYADSSFTYLHWAIGYENYKNTTSFSSNANNFLFVRHQCDPPATLDIIVE